MIRKQSNMYISNNPVMTTNKALFVKTSYQKFNEKDLVLPNNFLISIMAHRESFKELNESSNFLIL